MPPATIAGETEELRVATYWLGRLAMTIAGDGPVADTLRREYEPVRSATSPSGADDDGVTYQKPVPHMQFELVEEAPRLSGVRCGSDLEAGHRGYRAEHTGFTYRVLLEESPDDGPGRGDPGGGPEGPAPAVLPERGRIEAAWTNAPGRPPFLPDAVYRWWNWNYLWPHEHAAKDLVYNVLDPITGVLHLGLGQTWLHASSFARDGRGVAVTGAGGTGKTTTMAKLIMEDGWRFLSDDLALVDREGTIWRSPKLLQVYAYNVAGQQRLREALLAERSLVDRLSWQWNLRRRGPRGVRRRVHAETLFGDDRVTHRAPLTDLILLERGGVDEAIVTDVSAAELAARASFVVLAELNPLASHALALHGAGHGHLLPHPSAFLRTVEQILLDAANKARTRRIAVPESMGPDALADLFRAELGGR